MAIGGNFTNSISKLAPWWPFCSASASPCHIRLSPELELGPAWAQPSALPRLEEEIFKSQACGQRWIIQAGFKQTYTTQASATASRGCLQEWEDEGKKTYKGK